MQKAIISILLVLSINSYANDIYAVPVKDGVITMDVVKNDGIKGGRTWLCKSLRECYIKVLEAEERGATQYCESITLKRDGKVVWRRDYNDQYWGELQRLKKYGWYK